MLAIGYVLSANGNTGISGQGKMKFKVLGYSLWQRDLAGDANAIGKTMIVDGERRAIIGIMRREFRYYMPPGMSAYVSVPGKPSAKPENNRCTKIPSEV